ncbi:MAG TPA: sulfite exporter TauE/SafE family protein [Stellaceae bacterium]|jgi:uncharacterized membrane protein YfcA|nr:sulfite exporter TauE/SafE family protein [Stellaceae bacterium]
MADWAAHLSLTQYLLGLASGSFVGFCLGLVGGGGSILAVPLIVYVVGVPNPHLAIGTSALAVAINAAAGLACHARAGHVKWRCAGLYAGVGVAGALAGSTIGKAVDGQKLLALFALVMLLAGAMILRRRRNCTPGQEWNRRSIPRIVALGFGTGAFSGFFGIGGGFLIVPGLVASTGMAMLNAIGSSLVAVTAFGLTTALSYAASGLVDWYLAGAFILGGGAGSYLGMAMTRRLSASAVALPAMFAGLIFAVALYMLWRSAGGA